MTDNGRIKLLIAEDHPLLSEAFNIFFREQLNIEVVGKTANTEETLRLCKQVQPDVILVSSKLRPANILNFIHTLCQQNPSVRIVVLSSNIDGISAEKYLEAGASQAVVQGVFASDLLAIVQQEGFK
jgi:DNA-binding NarL/FixJ family response regulator